MKISNLYNITFSEIKTGYDIFIGVAGDEPRSFYLLKSTNIAQKAKEKFVIPYKDDTIRPDDYPKDIIWINNANKIDNPIWAIVEEFLVNEPDRLSVIIDYSSMSRLYYGSFLRSCYEYAGKTKLVLCFIYNIAKPCPPPCKQSFHFEPMHGYSKLRLPQNPTALIIGLGYEEGRAYSLKDYFDAEIVYIFRTDKNSSEKYYELVSQNNERLLRNLATQEQSNIFEYSLDNIAYTHKMLSDLCIELSDRYRIVIAPCGPKPFTLISLLVSLRSDNVDVWRIHNVDKIAEKEASDKNIVTMIEMIPEKEEIK